jgi:hypothetical protein
MNRYLPVAEMGEAGDGVGVGVGVGVETAVALSGGGDGSAVGCCEHAVSVKRAARIGSARRGR